MWNTCDQSCVLAAILRGRDKGAETAPEIQHKAVFGPDTIAAMSKAFEEACIALRVFAGDEKGREIVATRIIDLARNGLVDPNALRDRVISEAGRSL